MGREMKRWKEKENKDKNENKKQKSRNRKGEEISRRKRNSKRRIIEYEIHKYISNYSWVKLDRKSSISSLVWPREVVNLLISSSTPREVVELLIYSSTPKELVEPLISVKLQEK